MKPNPSLSSYCHCYCYQCPNTRQTCSEQHAPSASRTQRFRAWGDQFMDVTFATSLEILFILQIYTYRHTYIHTYMFGTRSRQRQARYRANIHTYIHKQYIYIYICIHTRIYTYIQMFTHPYNLSSVFYNVRPQVLTKLYAYCPRLKAPQDSKHLSTLPTNPKHS